MDASRAQRQLEDPNDPHPSKGNTWGRRHSVSPGSKQGRARAGRKMEEVERAYINKRKKEAMRESRGSIAVILMARSSGNLNRWKGHKTVSGFSLVWIWDWVSSVFL
jgi:hypothetical protein